MYFTPALVWEPRGTEEVHRVWPSLETLQPTWDREHFFVLHDSRLLARQHSAEWSGSGRV